MEKREEVSSRRGGVGESRRLLCFREWRWGLLGGASFSYQFAQNVTDAPHCIAQPADVENDRGDTRRGEFASSNGPKGGGRWGGYYSHTSILNKSTSSKLFSGSLCACTLPSHNLHPKDPGKASSRKESAGGDEVGFFSQAGEASLQYPDGKVDFGKAPSAEANPFHPSSGTAAVRDGGE